MFRRAELIEAVQEHHVANGGLPGNADLTAATKKALSVLVRDGLLEQTGAYGLWRWVVEPEQDGLPGLDDALEDEDAEELELTDQTIVEGTGSGSVYVYFFPSYKLLADLRQEDRWPVKVGMTAVSQANIRISEQQGTAMPEEPMVAYIRKIDTPHRLERCIHSVLFYRGQQIDDAPGREWFKSNPDEIKAIIDWILSSPQ